MSHLDHQPHADAKADQHCTFCRNASGSSHFLNRQDGEPSFGGLTETSEDAER